MHKKTPLVSVFIPYYNDKKYLKKSIESVLAQTYENFELILLNHASTDGSRDIAHSYSDKRIKHIDMKKNYGAGGGILFEKMLEASNGKYAKPFCADDIMLSDCLQKLVDYMEKNPNIDFAFGNIEYINDQDEDLNENWFHQRPGFSVNNTETDLIRMYVLHRTSMLPYIGSIAKRTVLLSIKYNYTFIMMFDMSIWFSLLCKNYKIGYLDVLCANYRIHTGQMSAINKAKWSAQICFYEASLFWQIILTIEDVSLAKKVFFDSPFKDKLKLKSDIPFYVIHSCFYKYQPMTYILLSQMLSNKEYLAHIEKEFGYGIKELRSIISNGPDNKEFHAFTYGTRAKDLNLLQLLFLGMRRIYFLITLRYLRHYLKNHKKMYSS